MSNRAAKPIKAGIGMPVMLDILAVSHVAVRGASSGSRNHCSTAGTLGEQCGWAEKEESNISEWLHNEPYLGAVVTSI